MNSSSASSNDSTPTDELNASAHGSDAELTGAATGAGEAPNTSAGQAEPRAAEEPRTVGGTEPSAREAAQAQANSDSSEPGSPAPAFLDNTPAPEEKPPAPEEELSRVRDQLLRTAADFDNFRKRSRKEIADADRQGRGELLRELLPVFDNLERAAAHASSTTDVQALADGIALVMRQFLDTLSRLGIERVVTLGAPFDPAVHEAIQHMPTAEHAPGMVAAEVQAGYRMGDRLIRPALVVVAKEPSN